MKILVIEDNSIQRKALIKIIKEIDLAYEVYDTDDMEEGLKIAEKENISLFYVDIHLNGFSGLTFAEKIRNMHQYKLTWIVFITSHIKHMIEAFKEIHCYDYIIKPYEKNQIVEITTNLLGGALTHKSKEHIERRYITLDFKGITVKLYIDEIIFIEVNLRTCEFYTKSGKYELKNSTFKKVKELLNSPFFVQVHRSYMVNVHYMKAINRIESPWNIQCEGYKGTIPVGDKFKNHVLAEFRNETRDLG